MIKQFVITCSFLCYAYVGGFAQDTPFNPDEYSDGSTEKKYCSQKLINQTPTKLIGIGYEYNFGFKNTISQPASNSGTDIGFMGGLRTQINILAISTNKFILMLGNTYWGSKTCVDNTSDAMSQVYRNRMDIESIQATAFKPLDEKHFVIAQFNVDGSYISNSGSYRITRPSLTLSGSAIYGWKKDDYTMWGLGVSRTYRMGRPLIIPVLLYNKTFNEQWGVEALLPARAHARYNFSTQSMLLAGYELEGQQFDLGDSDLFLQRGEIKPRIMFEQKLRGVLWLSAQLGYRINGRFNLVDRYNGKETNEVVKNNWGNSPYFNIGFYIVSP